MLARLAIVFALAAISNNSVTLKAQSPAAEPAPPAQGISEKPNAKKPAEKRNTAKKSADKESPAPEFAPITDDPKLPRVLLIGDSISMGYTLPTRAILAGRANVHRIPTNGATSANVLKNLDSWLG